MSVITGIAAIRQTGLWLLSPSRGPDGCLRGIHSARNLSQRPWQILKDQSFCDLIAGLAKVRRHRLGVRAKTATDRE